MASDLQSIRTDLRDLEQRMLDVHSKLGEQIERQPLEAIAATIRSFAEMEMMEAAKFGERSTRR